MMTFQFELLLLLLLLLFFFFAANFSRLTSLIQPVEFVIFLKPGLPGFLGDSLEPTQAYQ